MLLALLSGLFERNTSELYLLALLGFAALAITGGLRYQRFAFVVYGVLYGYVGISARLLRDVSSSSAALAYSAIASTIVIVSLVVVARRFGREE